MFDDYGREIYQELQQLNSNFEEFLSWFQPWTESVIGFWDQVIQFCNNIWDLFPPLLFLIVLFVGVNFLMKLFFPRWSDV